MTDSGSEVNLLREAVLRAELSKPTLPSKPTSPSSCEEPEGPSNAMLAPEKNEPGTAGQEKRGAYGLQAEPFHPEH